MLNRAFIAGPYAVTMFANARFLDGKDTGLADLRSLYWEVSHDIRTDYEACRKLSTRVGLPDRYYRDLYDYFADVRKLLLRYAEGMGFALVEDYVYSKRTPGGGRDSIEAGAVVRTAMAEIGTPLLLVQPAMWKSLTIGNLKKGTVELNRAYCQVVEKKYGRAFSTTDEADAFLIYVAAVRVWRGGGKTDAQRRLSREIAEVRERTVMV